MSADSQNAPGSSSLWMGAMIHLADSALPVGSYAHSFGLEGLCQAGVVSDRDSLRRFLERDVRKGLTAVDLPLMVRSHAATMDGDADAVRRWDEESWALRPTRQLREAATKIGRQTWLLYQRTWNEPASLIDRSWFPRLQAPVVTGSLMAAEGVPVDGCLWTGSYQVYSALVQAALKLVPLGPMASQRLLRSAMDAVAADFPAVLAMPDEHLGTFNPLWDIAASRHERAEARLFIS